MCRVFWSGAVITSRSQAKGSEPRQAWYDAIAVCTSRNEPHQACISADTPITSASSSRESPSHEPVVTLHPFRASWTMPTIGGVRSTTTTCEWRSAGFRPAAAECARTMISKRSPEVRPRPVRSSVAENDELTLKPLGSSHAVQASDPNAGPTSSPEAAHFPIGSSTGGLPPAPSAPCAVGESRAVGSGMEDALATNSPLGAVPTSDVTFEERQLRAVKGHLERLVRRQVAALVDEHGEREVERRAQRHVRRHRPRRVHDRVRHNRGARLQRRRRRRERRRRRRWRRRRQAGEVHRRRELRIEVDGDGGEIVDSRGVIGVPVGNDRHAPRLQPRREVDGEGGRGHACIQPDAVRAHKAHVVASAVVKLARQRHVRRRAADGDARRHVRRAITVLLDKRRLIAGDAALGVAAAGPRERYAIGAPPPAVDHHEVECIPRRSHRSRPAWR